MNKEKITKSKAVENFPSTIQANKLRYINDSYIKILNEFNIAMKHTQHTMNKRE